MQLHRGDPVLSAHGHHVGSVIDGRVRPFTKERGGSSAPVTLVSVRRHHDDVGMLRRQPDGAETGRQCLPVGIVTHPHLLAQLEPPTVELQHRRRIGVRIDVLPEPRDVGLRMRFSDRDERPHHLRRHDHRGPHRHRVHSRTRRHLTERVERGSQPAGGARGHGDQADPSGVGLKVPRGAGGSQRRSRPRVHERRFLEPQTCLEQSAGPPVGGMVVRATEQVEPSARRSSAVSGWARTAQSSGSPEGTSPCRRDRRSTSRGCRTSRPLHGAGRRPLRTADRWAPTAAAGG